MYSKKNPHEKDARGIIESKQIGNGKGGDTGRPTYRGVGTGKTLNGGQK